MQNQFYVWDDASWLDERGLLAVGREVLTGIKAVVPLGNLSVVATQGRIHVRDGGDWRPLPLSLTEEINALAYRASDGALFAAGNTLWRVSREGECQALPLFTKPPWWGAAVFREQRYLSDLKSVFLVEGESLVEVLPKGAQTNHNHSLHARGDWLRVVRDDGVHRFDGERWSLIPSPSLSE